MAIKMVVAGRMVIGEPGRMVRFRDSQGNTVLEIRTDGEVEVLDSENVLFRLDMAGDVDWCRRRSTT